jgi:hypothetical protein
MLFLPFCPIFRQDIGPRPVEESAVVNGNRFAVLGQRSLAASNVWRNVQSVENQVEAVAKD